MCRRKEKEEGGKSPAGKPVTSLNFSVNSWKCLVTENTLVSGTFYGSEAERHRNSRAAWLSIWLGLCIHPSLKNVPSNLGLSPVLSCYEHPTSNNELFLLPK